MEARTLVRHDVASGKRVHGCPVAQDAVAVALAAPVAAVPVAGAAAAAAAGQGAVPVNAAGHYHAQGKTRQGGGAIRAPVGRQSTSW